MKELMKAQREAARKKAQMQESVADVYDTNICLLYTSPSPRDGATSRMPSSA